VHVQGLQFALARGIGVGIRPEHIQGARSSLSGRRLVTRVAVCAGIVAAIAILAARRRYQIPWRAEDKGQARKRTLPTPVT